MAANCDEEGRIKIDNMTRSERRGYHKLLKRTRAKEIIISRTDKSSRNTASTYESYMAQGLPHTSKDPTVSWKTFNIGRKKALSHTKVLSKVFNMGSDQGETAEARLRAAMNEETSVVPNLIMTQKTPKHL